MNISVKLPTEKFDGPRYSIVAWCRGHEILFYREFGSYQGDWAMVSYCDGEYYVWKGYYGSCSGCDAYEADMGSDMGYGDHMASGEGTQKFAKDYTPFLEVPASTMRNLATQGWKSVGQILPANIRAETIDGYDWDALAKDVALIAKLKESLPISSTDVLEAGDQEIKQRALKTYGYERFLADVDAKTLDETGDNRLVGIADIKLLSLKDSSTDRRYLLRVPPDITGVQEGVAWTFNLQKEEYRPLVET